MENESEVIKMHIILLMCFYSSKLRLGLHFVVDSGCSSSCKKIQSRMQNVYCLCMHSISLHIVVIIKLLL